MPIYEYQCTACAHRIEKIQKISDSPLVDCPNCMKPALKKMVSAAAFRLKGSGWYETDFKTGNKKNVSGDSTSGSVSKSSDTASGADSGKSSTTGSSDSTPAPTPAAKSK